MSDQAYTYLFCDWKTREIIAELPVIGATFDLKLNEPGNFQGFVPLFEADGERDKIPNSLIKDATLPGRRHVIVRRGPKQIVWAGWIWSRVYQSNSNLLQLNGQTMESYPFKRILPFSLDRDNFPVSEYIALLWTQIENNWQRVGVEIDSVYDNVHEKRNFRYGYSQAMYIGEIIEDILDTVDSPDYRIDFDWDDNDLLRYKLRVGWPRLQRDVKDTGLTFEFPGNIKNYWYRENVSQSATSLIVQSGGYGSSAEIQPVYPDGGIDWDPDYPELQMKMSQRKLNNANQIQKWGRAQLRKRKPPISVFTAEAESGSQPYLGDYKLGDQVYFYVKDPRFPEGRRFTKRLLGYSVTPRRSDSAEDVKLTFNGGEDEFL